MREGTRGKREREYIKRKGIGKSGEKRELYRGGGQTNRQVNKSV